MGCSSGFIEKWGKMDSRGNPLQCLKKQPAKKESGQISCQLTCRSGYWMCKELRYRIRNHSSALDGGMNLGKAGEMDNG
jgi:hypothetical protein